MTNPPKDLKARGPGRKFYATILAEFDPTFAELELLAAACRTLDRLGEIDAALADGELIVPSARGTKVNPLLAESRHHRSLFAKLLQQLGLEEEAPASKSAAGRKMALLRWNGGGRNAS